MANKHMKKCLESWILKKMQVKITMRYHFMPIMTAKIKKKNNKHQWRFGKIKTIIHCWLDCKIMQPLLKLKVSQNVNHNIMIWSIDSTLILTVWNQENWKHCPHKNLYIRIYCSIIPNIQNVETTLKFINWWLGKQNMVYPYDEILSSHKKK